MSPRSKNNRRGTATVELAMVSPLVFLFVFAAIEFGRLLMAFHGLEEAAREGCRVAVLGQATVNDVQQTVANRLAAFGISDHIVTINPNPPSNACQWEPVTVTIAVTYDDVSWLPTPNYLAGKTLTVSSTLPMESDQCTTE